MGTQNGCSLGERVEISVEMNPAAHSHGRRRYSRRGRLQLVMLILAVVVVILLIATLFWVLSSPRFVKPNSARYEIAPRFRSMASIALSMSKSANGFVTSSTAVLAACSRFVSPAPVAESSVATAASRVSKAASICVT